MLRVSSACWFAQCVRLGPLSQSLAVPAQPPRTHLPLDCWDPGRGQPHPGRKELVTGMLVPRLNRQSFTVAWPEVQCNKYGWPYLSHIPTSGYASPLLCMKELAPANLCVFFAMHGRQCHREIMSGRSLCVYILLAHACSLQCRLPSYGCREVLARFCLLLGTWEVNCAVSQLQRTNWFQQLASTPHAVSDQQCKPRHPCLEGRAPESICKHLRLWL